jgi:DNA-binding NarL/FixJ family response regulator
MSSGSTPGGRVLKQKSTSILVVEDEQLDGDRLDAVIHAVLGYEVTIRRAKTLMLAVDAALDIKPDLVMLDDRLKPMDNADATIPYLRRAGYIGPIVAMSSLLTRKRTAELLRLGATHVLHKDDFDGTSFAAAIDTVQKAIAEGRAVAQPSDASLVKPEPQSKR